MSSSERDGPTVRYERDFILSLRWLPICTKEPTSFIPEKLKSEKLMKPRIENNSSLSKVEEVYDEDAKELFFEENTFDAYNKESDIFKGMKRLTAFLMFDLQEVNCLKINTVKIWKNLSAIFGHLIAMRALSLTKLKEYFQKASIIDNGQGSIFLTDIFLSIELELLENLWLESGLHLEDFMSATEVPNFIKANKFEFLKMPKKQSVSLPFVGVDRKLLEMFSLNVSTDKIIEWKKTNTVSKTVANLEFLKLLATTIFQYCCTTDGELSSSKLREKYISLRTYIADNAIYELQCLYALQKFVNQLGNPKGLILKFFEQFHQDNIISVDSFLAWKSSKNPFEIEGKDTSLKELKDFFKEIKKGDSNKKCFIKADKPKKENEGENDNVSKEEEEKHEKVQPNNLSRFKNRNLTGSDSETARMSNHQQRNQPIYQAQPQFSMPLAQVYAPVPQYCNTAPQSPPQDYVTYPNVPNTDQYYSFPTQNSPTVVNVFGSHTPINIARSGYPQQPLAATPPNTTQPISQAAPPQATFQRSQKLRPNSIIIVDPDTMEAVDLSDVTDRSDSHPPL